MPMTVRIGLIRHGPTAWNRQKRLQGRSDQPLDADARDDVSGWSLPIDCEGWAVFSSPLNRARDTAELLCGRPPSLDERLIEMSFGAWEGRTLSELRAQLGDEMKALEDRGLDFKAPDGESPREVMTRLAPFYREISESSRNTLLFCHNGVIRATMAWAVGWNMLGKPPVKLKNACLHLFELDPTGKPSLVEANIPLSGETA